MTDQDSTSGKSLTTKQYFDAYQRHLLGVAYRMLGSVHDAEEVVQEAFLRYESASPLALDNPKAWFTRVCTRICLDRMKRLSSKLEEYPGQWLPEPFVETADRPAIDETLSIALLVGLNSLSSKERAVFLLHDIFDYNFNEVADTLELNAPTCRQIAVRARKKIREARSIPRQGQADLKRITDAFLQAIREGDAEVLQGVLAEGVKLFSDGGGKVTAVPYPLIGRAKVQTFLMRIYLPYRNGRSLRTSVRWFNGAPGLLFEPEGEASSAFQLDVDDGKIKSIYVQRNPDKLRRLLESQTVAGK